ncbi:hypothetical protein E2566_13835 [Pectobacterium punjabense]|uniref:DUF4760 domain-containing protein n=1 Tax=Pectobacterium punjabense TaxID=2108399 RepID=A0ABX6L5D1_9GAMM|nr:hypothetical protein [Pectobacterium punjabense]MBS4429233.1 hypothetical protein [Pectobacterium punjabense]PTA65194.1 hypothetical protein C9I36_06135 [Pectobacterium punjabense]QJA20932.1 hypothetical protein E2566_13835 [Pectobacterium punjabense]
MENIINKTCKFIKSINSLYHKIGVGALLLLIVKCLVLNKITAPFTWMYDVSAVVEGVLASIIASYIFYVVAIYPEIYKDKCRSSVFVISRLRIITTSFQTHIQEFGKKASIDLDVNSSVDDVGKAILNISPFKKDAPLVLGYTQPFQSADWFEYFLYGVNKIEEDASKLINSRAYMNMSTITLLNQIIHSGWCSTIKILNDAKGGLRQDLNPFYSKEQSDKSQQLYFSLYNLMRMVQYLKSEIEKYEID